MQVIFENCQVKLGVVRLAHQQNYYEIEYAAREISYEIPRNSKLSHNHHEN